MRRRTNNDVFVIGDELLDAEASAARERDRESEDGTEPYEPRRGVRLPSRDHSRSGRWLATAVPVVAVAAIGVAELSGSADSVPELPEASAPVALRPTARPAAVPPSPVPPPRRVRHREPTRNRPSATRHQQDPFRESKREPIAHEAPEISPESDPSPPPSAPTPGSPPAPPSPPSSPGGGPGGVEREFGFER